MERKLFIPYSNNQIITINERGERKLMNLAEVNTKFWGEAPITNESITPTEIMSQLSTTDEKLERALVLINSLNCTLGDKIDIYLETDEEGKDEFRELFILLDIIKEEIQIAKTITYSVNTIALNGINSSL